MTALVLNAAPKLKCVANFAVGYNNIDFETAKKRGICVTNTPDVLTEATADIVWALILASARRVPESERLMRKSGFKGWGALLLLGAGSDGQNPRNIWFWTYWKGCSLARLGMEYAYSLLPQRHRESLATEKRYNAKYVSFEVFLKRSDILGVNVPLTSETKHRFTHKEFKIMKRNSIFINSSRGRIYCEADLVSALKSKTIASAGLDVYEFEIEVNKKLLKLNNCKLLPRLGSAARDTRDKMAFLAAENIELVLAGHGPKIAFIK